MIIPVLRVFDEAKVRQFYIDFLGFKIDWEHRFEENFPLYMQISKGDWVIHLTEHHGDCCPGAALMLQMQAVEVYQEELRQKQYKYARPSCEHTEWETVEMAITDPFGNRLTFYENVVANESVGRRDA